MVHEACPSCGALVFLFLSFLIDPALESLCECFGPILSRPLNGMFGRFTSAKIWCRSTLLIRTRDEQEGEEGDEGAGESASRLLVFAAAGDFH